VNELPCHQTLEQFLDEGRLGQSSTHRMVGRRLRQAGIGSQAGNHNCI
jgi:hypothetical protein